MTSKSFFIKFSALIFLCSNSVSYAQEEAIACESDKYEPVCMNFLGSNVFPDTSKLEIGKTYVFIVHNVNRKIYKIEGEISQEDYNAEIPSIFKDIKLPGILNLSIPSSGNVVGVNTIHDGTDIKDEIREKLLEIKGSASELYKISLYENELKNISKNCELAYTEIDSKVLEKTNEFEGVASSDRADQAVQLEKYLTALVDSTQETYNRLSVLFNQQQNLTSELTRKNELELIKLELTKPEEDDSGDLDSEYASYVFAKSNLEYNTKINKAFVEELKTEVASAKTVVDEIKKLAIDNKISVLLDMYNAINRSNFTYVSEPVKVKSDAVNFKLTIKSEGLLSCDASNSRTIKKTFKVKGGWKVDFSTGVFFNGGDDDFFGGELYYSTASASTSVIKAKDGGDRLLLGIGGLMHIYKRSAKPVNFAISPGLSSSTDFDQLNFHLGGSALFGEKNRIVITAGVTLRESNILDKSFKLDTEYETSALPESPPLVKVFPRFGYFLSLTYNFSKFKS